MPALPGLEIAIHPERHDHAIPAHPVKLFQQHGAVFSLADVVHQAHAEDAVDSVVRHLDRKGRGLQRLDTFDDFRRLRFAGNLDHRRRIVRPDDHPVGFFGQYRPETSGATGQVQHQAWFARQRQRATRQLFIPAIRQASCQSVVMFA